MDDTPSLPPPELPDIESLKRIRSNIELMAPEEVSRLAGLCEVHIMTAVWATISDDTPADKLKEYSNMAARAWWDVHYAMRRDLHGQKKGLTYRLPKRLQCHPTNRPHTRHGAGGERLENRPSRNSQALGGVPSRLAHAVNLGRHEVLTTVEADVIAGMHAEVVLFVELFMSAGRAPSLFPLRSDPCGSVHLHHELRISRRWHHPRALVRPGRCCISQSWILISAASWLFPVR